MNIRPIKNDADLEWALKEIEPYFLNEPELGSAEGDRFDVLATLIEAYERENWPALGSLPPADALREFMALTGKTQRDLAELLGYRSRASDILLGKRMLSVQMIRKLVQEWGMPAELLLGEAKDQNKAA